MVCISWHLSMMLMTQLFSNFEPQFFPLTNSCVRITLHEAENQQIPRSGLLIASPSLSGNTMRSAEERLYSEESSRKIDKRLRTYSCSPMKRLTPFSTKGEDISRRSHTYSLRGRHSKEAKLKSCCRNRSFSSYSAM